MALPTGEGSGVHEALRGRVNLKQIIVTAIAQTPIATNETLQEHGVRPRDELVLFTSFGVVRGKLTADEETGDRRSGVLHPEGAHRHLQLLRQPGQGFG